MLQKKSLLILILLLIVGCQSGNANLPTEKSPTNLPFPTITATQTPTKSVLDPSAFYLSPTPTSAFATPRATSTNTPTPMPTSVLYKRGLDVPIGDYYKFVIHKSPKDGEHLEDFARKYNTTVEAITTINYSPTNPTWGAVLFVIPVNFSNVEGLPIFVVYQIKEEDRGTSWDGLATLLRVNPIDLKYYNGVVTEGDRPLVGDLILVPWPRPAPTIHWDEPEGTREPSN